MPMLNHTVNRIQYLARSQVSGIAQVAIAEAHAYLVSLQVDRVAPQRAALLQRLRDEGPNTLVMDDVLNALDGTVNAARVGSGSGTRQ